MQRGCLSTSTSLTPALALPRLAMCTCCESPLLCTTCNQRVSFISRCGTHAPHNSNPQARGARGAQLREVCGPSDEVGRQLHHQQLLLDELLGKATR